jgi:hypothetical protein
LRAVELFARAGQLSASSLHLAQQPVGRDGHRLEHLCAGATVSGLFGVRQQRARFCAETGKVRLEAVVGLADDADQGAHRLQERLIGIAALGLHLLRWQPGDGVVLRFVVLGRSNRGPAVSSRSLAGAFHTPFLLFFAPFASLR